MFSRKGSSLDREYVLWGELGPDPSAGPGRKATQKALVGGYAEERLPERRAARSKSAMAFDNSAA